jgi:hypothetical protein
MPKHSSNKHKTFSFSSAEQESSEFTQRRCLSMDQSQMDSFSPTLTRNNSEDIIGQSLSSSFNRQDSSPVLNSSTLRNSNLFGRESLVLKNLYPIKIEPETTVEFSQNSSFDNSS